MSSRAKKPKLTKTPISEIFLKACEEGNMEKIKSCLALDVDINCTDEEGHSALFKVLRYLFCFGENEKEEKEIVDTFLQNPDLDVEQINREKILGWNLDADQIRKLCNLPDIDVNAGNPLRQAALANDTAIIKILAENPGLNWNNNEDGDYPIMSALRCGHHEIVELLLEEPTVDLDVLLGQKSVAHVAVMRKERKVVSHDSSPVKCVELLSKDPRVNWSAKDGNGETPIMIALKNEDKEILKILFKTPGVDLGDIIKTDRGNDLLKEMLREADETKKRELVKEIRERLASTLPECPVCDNQFRKDSHVFQCFKGHFVCWDCEPRILDCPVCRKGLIGRAFDFEKFLRKLDL